MVHVYYIYTLLELQQEDLPEAAEASPVLDTTVEYPTDPGHFMESLVSTDVKEAIVQHGPCQPKGPFQANHQGRRFCADWYKRRLQSSQEIHRDWLVYSPSLQKMYCFSCWLFSNPNDAHYEGNWAEVKKGVSNFQKGLEKIRSHEKTDIHLNTYTKWKGFLSGQSRVDKELKHQRDMEIEKNRKILERLLDCALFLAKQNLAFRGHDESSSSSNRGNFVELIHLVAKYDPLLASHLADNSKSKQKYLSHTIQNDLLQSINDTILKKIVTEIKSAKYYAVLADTTTDISHKDQFSLCLRHVNLTGDVLEQFISFQSVPDGSATSETLEHMVLKQLADIGLNVGDIRGQSYDGASNISGAYSGLQTRIKQHSKNAFYMWCSNHRLNLVLVDSATSFVEAKSYFGLLERLYTLFAASHKRYAVFESTMDELGISKSLRLKHLSETRWSARYDAVNTVRKAIPGIIG